jgi:hypothetical protein
LNKFTQSFRSFAPLSSIFLLSQLVIGCGGSSSSNSEPPTPPPIVSPIPDTAAVAATTAPQLPASTPIASVNQAVLRHVHRNTLNGDIKPDGNYVDSPNAKVERLIDFGFYQEINRQANNRYLIQPQDNGLAYFRVSNTKPNGKVRVHNFHGVPAGHYMTLDSTDVADNDSFDSQCRDVAIRFNNLPQQVASSATLQVNGSVRSDTVYDAGRGYIENITLCPVDLNQHYLAVAVFEGQDSTINYGFNYYQGLQNGDLLDIDIAHQANTISWSSDHPVDNEFSLAGMKQGWRVKVGLYNSDKQNDDNRFIPQFTELALDSYRFSSNLTDLTIGVKMFDREFGTELPQIDFTVNDIELDDVTMTPLDVRWNNVGQSQPEVVSGIVFNTDLDQTYAFMSMDPDVLSDEKFRFPLDDLELLLDGGLVGLTSAAGTTNGNNQFISDAALFSGYFYWPNPVENNDTDNSDVFITASITSLLELLLELKLEKYKTTP